MELDLTPQGTLSIDCIVNGPVQTNTYFVTSAGETAVIDPAWDGERLAEKFLSEHPGARITTIVCTHGHADHVGGVAGLRRSLGPDAAFLLPAGDAGFVPGALVSMKEMWGFEHEDPGEPTGVLHEGDLVAVGDVRLQVVETPGHTPGGIVLFAATADGDVAFVGDTLFPGSHGRTDLEGGDEALILRSLAKMARLLPASTLCLCGHGDATTMGREVVRNPFIAGRCV